MFHNYFISPKQRRRSTKNS